MAGGKVHPASLPLVAFALVAGTLIVAFATILHQLGSPEGIQLGWPLG